jgi:hypothetical protein
VESMERPGSSAPIRAVFELIRLAAVTDPSPAPRGTTLFIARGPGPEYPSWEIGRKTFDDPRLQ